MDGRRSVLSVMAPRTPRPTFATSVAADIATEDQIKGHPVRLTAGLITLVGVVLIYLESDTGKTLTRSSRTSPSAPAEGLMRATRGLG
jgi:hypothetical protein